jgi:hypothetical protein
LSGGWGLGAGGWGLGDWTIQIEIGIEIVLAVEVSFLFDPDSDFDLDKIHKAGGWGLPEGKPQLLQHLGVPAHDWIDVLNKEDMG